MPSVCSSGWIDILTSLYKTESKYPANPWHNESLLIVNVSRLNWRYSLPPGAVAFGCV